MEKKYIVFFVGEPKDGETLATFEHELDAIEFARKYWQEHEQDFDPTWGGVSITDPEGNIVENW